MDHPLPRQRLRITFGRGEQIKYITHLDMMRLWERLVRRARLPVSFSAAQPARPRLSLAAPLAVGVTSEAELLEMYLDTRLPLAPLARRLAIECPAGIVVNQIQEVALSLPSLQSLVRFSEYRVTIQAQTPAAEIEQRIAGVLAARELPRQRLRDKDIRRYDLRPQMDSLWLSDWHDGECLLGMLLQTDEHATGRPDDVLAVLGLADCPRSIQRAKLILAQPQPAASLGGRHPPRYRQL